jgi:hypothetical protein
MSNQFNHKHSYSRYFMAPVWIALALSGLGVAFLLGGTLVTDEWSRQDNEKLAEYKPGALPVGPEVSEANVDGTGREHDVNAKGGDPGGKAKGGEPGSNPETADTIAQKPVSLHTLVWRSPALALEWAAEGVKHDRIEFGLYRNLLRAALAQQDAGAHEIAFRSIRDVLQYGGAFADDLKAELKGLAPQVFITTTTSQAGIDAGAALEKELRNVGMTVVSVDRSDQVQIGGTKVSCYGAETCKDAKGLVGLLRGKGYDVVQTDTSSRSEDNSDDMASALYGAKVIRVALMDPKLTQTAVLTAIKSPSTPPHPKKSAQRTTLSNGGVRTAHR